MKKLILLLLGWLLFTNLIDFGTSYYAINNNLAVDEVGILGDTNTALIIHLGFSLLIMGLSFWLSSKYYDIKHKSFVFKLFIFMIILWSITDTAVAVNNILVILGAS